jgi:hypothetical protein
MFLFRPRRWRIQRIILSQTSWDNGPIYTYEVTLSNGAHLKYGSSKYLLLAIIKAIKAK